MWCVNIFVQQVKSEPSGPIPIRPAEPHPSVSASLTDANALLSGLTSSMPSGGSNLDSIRSLLEPNGMRPRKPCNCTKSQCLKLYCDCFANGEFCHLCNCTNCFNNLQHEEDRQKVRPFVDFTTQVGIYDFYDVIMVLSSYFLLCVFLGH